MTKIDRLMKWKRSDFLLVKPRLLQKNFFKSFCANDVLTGLALILRNILFTDFQKPFM